MRKPSRSTLRSRLGSNPAPGPSCGETASTDNKQPVPGGPMQCWFDSMRRWNSFVAGGAEAVAVRAGHPVALGGRRALIESQRTSVRQRIGPKLDVHGARHRALAAFLEPGRAVAIGAPQPAAFPAGVRIVDPTIEALGIEESG